MSKGVSARAFIKWAGGKQALAPRLASLFPSAYARYFEPFLGGGSVFLHVAPTDAILNDSNVWLIDTYKVVRDKPDELARALEALPNSRDDFNRIRRVDPSGLAPVRRAAHFIYLNKTCFRGLFRVNRKGEFNVPYGNYQRRYCDLTELRAASAVLAQARLKNEDFERTLERTARGDFAYLDPPYHKIGGYSDFNRYTPSQFREADHKRLARACSELDRGGVKWALSNSDTELVRTLFHRYRVREIHARREINLTAERRDITELLITNY